MKEFGIVIKFYNIWDVGIKQNQGVRFATIWWNTAPEDTPTNLWIFNLDTLKASELQCKN